MGEIPHIESMPAFDSQLVDGLMTAIIEKVPKQSVLFCVIDPTVGAIGSNLSMITSYFSPDSENAFGFAVVVGCEEISFRTTDAARKRVILAHIDGIRSLPEFAESTIVVCVVSNLGAEAENYGNYLREKVTNLVVMQEDHGRDGWRVTNDTVALGVQRMQVALKSGRIKFSPYDAKFHAQIVSELRCFERVRTIRPESPVYSNVKDRYSGRRHGSDDFACLMQLTLLVHDRFAARCKEYGFERDEAGRYVRQEKQKEVADGKSDDESLWTQPLTREVIDKLAIGVIKHRDLIEKQEMYYVWKDQAAKFCKSIDKGFRRCLSHLVAYRSKLAYVSIDFQFARNCEFASFVVDELTTQLKAMNFFVHCYDYSSNRVCIRVFKTFEGIIYEEELRSSNRGKSFIEDDGRLVIRLERHWSEEKKEYIGGTRCEFH